MYFRAVYIYGPVQGFKCIRSVVARNTKKTSGSMLPKNNEIREREKQHVDFIECYQKDIVITDAG